MSFKNAFLFNLQSETHLRDARHANQIYTQNNFAFAPKTKYMYHVRFDPHPDVGNSSTSNVFKFQKELGVLVKSADLPSFRASVENKQQYNRKKNVQTRVDYQDCRIAFHDDNTGVTRALLEEYYRYYFVDANKDISNSDASFQPRDKYKSKVPSYGLDNRKINPFFKSITIYQLARKDWVAYTLVNPLLTAWDHGSVESSSTDFNENTMSVAYEAVMYTSGSVAQDTPAGFADESVGYDVTDSPLGYLDDAMISGNDGSKGLVPSALGLGTSALLNKSFSNSPSKNISKEVATGVIGGLVTNVLSQNRLPVPDSQNQPTIVTSQVTTRPRSRPASDIADQIVIPNIVTTVLPPLVNSGALPNVDINTYNSSSDSQKAAYASVVADMVRGGDQKLIDIASAALDKLGE